jgi:ribokinase
VAFPRLAVVGSINVDLVARAERLPRPGETVTGATFSVSRAAKAQTRQLLRPAWGPQ